MVQIERSVAAREERIGTRSLRWVLDFMATEINRARKLGLRTDDDMNYSNRRLVYTISPKNAPFCRRILWSAWHGKRRRSVTALNRTCASAATPLPSREP